SYYRGATLALKQGREGTAAELYGRCRGLWGEVAEVNPSSRNKLALGLVQARLGDHESAAVFAPALLAGPQFSPGDGVEAVSVLALCGGAASGEARRAYYAEAIAGLKILVDKLGYRNVARLKTDPDLDPIRDEPEFQAVVDRL